MADASYSDLFEQFPFGTVPHPHYAAERSELEELRQYIAKGSRVLIEGPRRIGKTLLVKSTVPEDLLLLVDLKGLTSEEKVVNAIRRALERFTGREVGKAKKSIRKREAKLSAALGYVRGHTEESSDETDMEQLFGIIERIGHDRMPLVVFFDEVQTLMEFEGGRQIAERIRALSQHHDHVAYFFAGSNSYTLEKLTNDARSPFYKQLSRIVLQPLDRETFSTWIRNRLDAHECRITDEALEFVFQFARDIPGDVQRVPGDAFALAKARSGEPVIDIELVDFSITRTLSAEEASLDIIDKELRRNKRMLMLTIAAMLHEDRRHPITGQVARYVAQIDSPGTVKSTLESLAQDGLISIWNDRHQIDNPFLEAHLIRQFHIDYQGVIERLSDAG